MRVVILREIYKMCINSHIDPEILEEQDEVEENVEE